jgi:glycosyltransferase involved in cell wall biosynthesis
MKIALLTTDNRENCKQYDRPEPFFGTAPDALLQGFAQIKGVEVHVLSCTQQKMHSPAQLAENIWFHSLVVSKLGWLKTGYQGCIRAVRAKLREIRPDIVHGQGTERDCSLSAAFSGFPNVITVHGNMRVMAKLFNAKPFSYHWLAARLEPIALARSGGVVCITEYTREQVAQQARKTWVVPNAVDQPFFSIHPQPIVPPLILCVGTIDSRKNQNALMDALSPLAATLPFRVLFLGALNPDNPYGLGFKQRLEANPTWCKHSGFADRDSLRNFFSQASLVALPSIEDNCPMVVLEAMAAGIPVVASQVGGVPELIQPRQTGLMFDPQNSEQIRSAVLEAITQRDRAKAMAAAAQEYAQKNFHPLEVARRHLEIYRELLSN